MEFGYQRSSFLYGTCKITKNFHKCRQRLDFIPTKSSNMYKIITCTYIRVVEYYYMKMNILGCKLVQQCSGLSLAQVYLGMNSHYLEQFRFLSSLYE